MCKGTDMTVAEKESTIPIQKPRLRLAWPARTIPPIEECSRRGLRPWTRELLECKHLILLSLVCLGAALTVDYYAGVYVSSTPSVGVPDLILDRFPPVDLSFLFIYGYIVLVVGIFTYPLFFRVRMLHVAAIQFSLLLILRSLFMIFTHLETPPGSVPVSFPWFFGKLYFENDMFFSGHTAIPFLGFYLFRRSLIRYVFLAGSIMMGIVVLAMHLHYSIDVFAAFFMTYCSYRMGNAALRRLDPAHCE